MIGPAYLRIRQGRVLSVQSRNLFRVRLVRDTLKVKVNAREK